MNIRDANGDVVSIAQGAIGSSVAIYHNLHRSAVSYEATQAAALVVPANYLWLLATAHVTYAASAVVGNRQVALKITDSDLDEYAVVPAQAVQAGGATVRYMFAHGIVAAAPLAGYLWVPAPKMLMPAGFRLSVVDLANIDAAGDTYTIRTVVEETLL